MILQCPKHFVVIIIFLYTKFQFLITQTVFCIRDIFCQHTVKFSSLFIHGKDCRIIVQKTDPNTAMFFQP